MINKLFHKLLILSGVALLSGSVLANTPSAPTTLSSTNNPSTPYSPYSNLPSPKASQPLLVPQPPNVDAKGFILEDASTGQILAEKNIDTRMPPASLTKMMTLYITFQAIQDGRISLDDKAPISKKAWQTGGSRMFVKAGSTVPVHELIQGIIVDSGNDATVALAEYIAGSENAFVSLMNQQAQALGMTNTHYTDATGMPHPDHYSTPRDIATLARAIIAHFPNEYHFFKQKWFTYNGIKQPNRNRLLWRVPYVDGMKTGHTKAAGYCLVASGQQDNMRLVSVVMGAPTDEARAEDSQRLLTYGFRFFENHHLYDANKGLTKARVWQGENENVQIGLVQPINVVIPTGSYKNLKAEIEINEPLKAPIAKSERVGTLVVSLDGKQLMQRPLVALQSDPKGGLWTRMTDSVSLSWHNMFNKKDK